MSHLTAGTATRNATFVFSAFAISNAANFIFFAIAARFLPSVGALGNLAVLLMVSAAFQAVFTLALHRSCIKFVSEYIGKGQNEIARGIGKLVLLVGVMLGVLGSLSSFVILPLFFPLLLEPGYSITLELLVSIYVFPLILQQFVLSAFMAVEKFVETSVLIVLQSLFSYGGAVAFLLNGFGLPGIIAGLILGHLVSLPIGGILLRRTYVGGIEKRAIRPILAHSIPLMGSDVTVYLSQYLDRYILLLFLGQFALGLYAPVMIVISALALIVDPIRLALFPRFGMIRGSTGSTSLQAPVLFASRIVFFLVTPVAFGIAAFAEPCIVVFVGERFVGAAVALTVISITLGFTSGNLLLVNVLMVTDRTRVFMAISTIAILLDAAVSFLLIPSLGVVGAAIARSTFFLASFLITALYVDSSLKIRLDYMTMMKSTTAGISMIVVVVLIQQIVPSTAGLVFSVLIGALVYLMATRSLGILTLDDVEIIASTLPVGQKRFAHFMSKLLVMGDKRRVTRFGRANNC